MYFKSSLNNLKTFFKKSLTNIKHSFLFVNDLFPLKIDLFPFAFLSKHFNPTSIYLIINQNYLMNHQNQLLISLKEVYKKGALKMRYLKTLTVCLLLFYALFFACFKCFGEEIDLKVIEKIESGGNPLAFNERSGCIGLYQINPKGALADYNQFNKVKYSNKDMFSPEKNRIVASWYLNKRIPQMLKHFKKVDNINNRLISYNCGIADRCFSNTPKETVDYISKYKRLSE